MRIFSNAPRLVFLVVIAVGCGDSNTNPGQDASINLDGSLLDSGESDAAIDSSIDLGNEDASSGVDANIPDSGDIDFGIDAAAGEDAAADAGDPDAAIADAAVDASTPDMSLGCGAGCASGTYCHTPDGTCADTANGVCEPFDPNITCPTTSAPVCGCDGKSYLNDCLAMKAGVSVDHAGTCVCTSGGGNCLANQYCSILTNMCGATGTCQNKPSCPPFNSLQCGCDHITYKKACFAYQNDVAIAQSGACPLLPGCCNTNTDCAAGNECVGATNTTTMTTQGVCLPLPAAGSCWTNADCGSLTCTRASFCACGDSSCDPATNTLGACL